MGAGEISLPMCVHSVKTGLCLLDFIFNQCLMYAQTFSLCHLLIYLFPLKVQQCSFSLTNQSLVGTQDGFNIHKHSMFALITWHFSALQLTCDLSTFINEQERWKEDKHEEWMASSCCAALLMELAQTLWSERLDAPLPKCKRRLTKNVFWWLSKGVLKWGICQIPKRTQYLCKMPSV